MFSHPSNRDLPFEGIISVIPVGIEHTEMGYVDKLIEIAAAFFDPCRVEVVNVAAVRSLRMFRKRVDVNGM